MHILSVHYTGETRKIRSSFISVIQLKRWN